MRFIPLDEITIAEDRQRQTFDEDAMNELIESIGERGLIHALTVREDDGLNIVLVAGERRLRALRFMHEYAVPVTYDGRKVPLDMAPCVLPGEGKAISDLAALEIELFENIHREDLPWQERDAAIARWHAMREKQAEERGEKQTYTATASEILGRPAVGQPVTSIREAVTVAKHLDDPEVKKAASRKEALKVIERKATVAENVKRALEVGTVAPSSRHTLLQHDATTAVFSECSFDTIITDPPYGIGADKFGEQSDGHTYDDSFESWLMLMKRMAELWYKWAKPEAHAYVFCDVGYFHILKDRMEAADWYVWRTPLVWNKQNGTLPRPEHGPRRTYETILYAIKGNKKTLGIFPDVITCSADHSTTHPAQKPVELYCNLLRRSCRPGDMVLDSFCGSGTVFPAANKLSLTATGTELNANYYGEALKRLEEK